MTLTLINSSVWLTLSAAWCPRTTVRTLALFAEVLTLKITVSLSVGKTMVKYRLSYTLFATEILAGTKSLNSEIQVDNVNEVKMSYRTVPCLKKTKFKMMRIVPTTYTKMLMGRAGNSADRTIDMFEALLKVKRPGAPNVMTVKVARTRFRPSLVKKCGKFGLRSCPRLVCLLCLTLA